MDHEKLMNEFGGVMHEVWSHWMRHLFTQGWENSDGTFRIKRDKVEQWKRQMNAPFSELSGEEQTTDIKIFKDFFLSLPTNSLYFLLIFLRNCKYLYFSCSVISISFSLYSMRIPHSS